MYQLPLVLEERPVVPFLRDLLRTPEVDVNSIAVRLDDLCRSEQHLRVVGAELDYERTVAGPALFALWDVEVLIPVGFSFAFSKQLS